MAYDNTTNLRKAAVIDMGSNSLKMTNYNIDQGNRYKPYHHESVRVRLGGWFDDDTIKEKYVDRTIDVLKLFKNIVDFEGMDYVIPVATSAVREARNRDEVIGRISAEVGISFNVLNERREATYSYVGAARALQIPTCIFFDLGGGSLEMIYAKNYHIEKIVSLPLGALRLTQAFSGSDGYRSGRYESMRRHVSSLLPSRDEMGADTDTPIIAAGGTIRAITKYDQMRTDYPLNKVHNHTMSAESVQDIAGELRGMTPEKITDSTTIGSGRADIIQAGACVVAQCLDKMKSSRITSSAHGLREGTLAVYLSCGSIDGGHKTDAEIAHDASRIPDLPAPEHTRNIIRMMSSVNLISAREQELLAHAMIHIDKLSSFRDVDNVLYMVLDDDSMLSHRDQIIVALSLIHSKKKKGRTLVAKYRRILGKNDMRTVTKMSGIIAMCNMLHRTRTDVTASLEDGTLHLTAYPSRDPFPEFLFGRTCARLQESTGISVTSSISHAGAGQDVRQVHMMARGAV